MLLEREAELRLMADVLAGVGSSGGKVVLVRGEAGIGKSALVRDVVEKHRDEWFVLFGSCDDLLTPQPLGAFWEIAQQETTLSQPLEDVSLTLFSVTERSIHPLISHRPKYWVQELTKWVRS